MVRVLFVCLGNICRSPMAEAVFLHKVRAAGLEQEIMADSAGMGDWHQGQAPHRGTQQILQEKGIVYSHAARQIHRTDFSDFDYILTMDESNFASVHSLLQEGQSPSLKEADQKANKEANKEAPANQTNQAKIARLMDYAPDLGVREVPDPFYTGGFAAVYRLVEAATEGLLAAICREKEVV